MLLDEKEIKDYYRILGVPRNASAQQIRNAYRDLSQSLQTTPENEPQGPGSKALLFKYLTEAYEILTDLTKRAEYDRNLPPSDDLPNSGGGVSDQTESPSPVKGAPKTDKTVAVARRDLQDTIEALKKKYAYLSPSSRPTADASICCDQHDRTELMTRGEDFPDPEPSQPSPTPQAEDNATKVLSRVQDLNSVFSKLAEQQSLQTSVTPEKEYTKLYKPADADPNMPEPTKDPAPEGALPPAYESSEKIEVVPKYTTAPRLPSFRPIPRTTFNSHSRSTDTFISRPYRNNRDWLLWIVGCGPPLLTLLGVAIYYLTR